MARPIYVPQAGGFITFSDQATDAEITAYLSAKYPAPAPVAATPVPAPSGPDDSGILSRFAYGFGSGLTDIPGGIAALMYPSLEASETAGGRFSESARGYLEETLGIDPTKETTTSQMLAQGVGSLGSFLVPATGVAKGAALLGRGARLAQGLATATAAGQGVAVSAEQRAERIRDQLASGMQISEEDQLAAQRLSGLIGASEALPLSRFFGPLTTLLSKVPVSKAPLVERIVKNRLSRIVSAGAAEGAQEAASGIANDLMEYGVYNPDVELGQDLLSNAGTGAFAGSLLEGVIQLAAGRKLRAARQLQQDLASEGRTTVQQLRTAEAAQAAEDLRQYNVEGEVDIVPDDSDGYTAFRLRSPSGNIFGTFETPQAAEAAVEIYRQRTGAKVKVNKPKIEAEPEEAVEEGVNVPAAPAAKISKPVISTPAAVTPTAPEAVTPDVAPPEDMSPEPIIPVEPEPIPEEMPIGAVELPVEEQRFIEPEVVATPAPIEAPEAPRMEMRPSATVEQLTDLKAELFGTPMNVRDMTPEQLTRYETERDKRFPPVETPVYYDARVVETRPRTISEVMAKPEALRPLTPQAEAAQKRMFTELDNRLKAIVPEDVGLNIKTMIEEPGYLVRGRERAPEGDLGHFVELASGYINPNLSVDEMIREMVGVLNHEAIHVLRTKGLFRSSEWRILSKAAENTKVPGKKYTYLDKAQAIYEPMGGAYADPDAVIEEAVAEMYKDWVNGKNAAELGKSGAGQNSRGLFNRLTEFLRKLFRVLSSDAHKDVFKRIDAGELKARTPDASGRAGSRLSAAPVNRPALIERRKAIMAEMRPLAEKGTLTGGEAYRFQRLGNELNEVMYDLLRTKPLDPSKIKSEAERMSVLPQSIVAQAYNDALADRDVFMAINNAAAGTVNDAVTDVDRMIEGSKGSDLYAAFAPTRAALREAFGDTMRLYRAEGMQRKKATQNWATTREYAQQFGQNVTERDIPVDNILAVNVGTGNYHEMIVGTPPARTRFSASPLPPAAVKTETGLDVAEIPEDNIGSSSVYMRRDREPLKGKVNIIELGKAFDAAFLKKFDRQYEITNSADYKEIIDSVVDEVKHQMQQAQSGIGWYDHDIQDVFNELSKSFPILKDPDQGPVYRRMFTVIAGVMSNGMKAKANVELAAINFAHFLNTGSFSPIHPFTKTGWNQRSNIMGPQIQMLNSMIKDQRFAPRPGSNNPNLERLENFLEYMFSEHSVRDINSLRAAHGTKSPAKIGKLDDKRLGMYAFGPKFGPFILNLNGMTDETVDSWASRSFYRHMGRSVNPNGEMNDAPTGPAHREAMKQALRDVADRTKLSSRDVQAVLWFYEKELYNQLGQRVPLEVFSDGAREFTRKYGTGSSRPPQSRTEREREIARAVGEAGTKAGAGTPGTKGGVRFSASPALDSDEFKRWFKNSKAVNPDGTPKVMYHGTGFDFDRFGKSRSGAVKKGLLKRLIPGDETGPFYFSASTKFANQYATQKLYKGGRGEDIKSGGRMIPVYISAQNPFDFDNPDHIDSIRTKFPYHSEGFFENIQTGNWADLEQEDVQRAIRDLGFDGFYLIESGFKNLAVYSPVQVKSIFNQFEEGTATSPRFSAAPLPAYIETQNQTLFAPEPNEGFFATMTRRFLDPPPEAISTTTQAYGAVDISKADMKRLRRRAALVDKNAFIEYLEKLANQKTTGNFQRQMADFSATAALAMRNRSSHVAVSMFQRGKLVLDYARPGDVQSATMKVEDDPDSMAEIIKILMEPGPVDPQTGEQKDKREVFKSYATAMRARNKAAAGIRTPGEVDQNYINTVIPFTQQNYPEVIRAYEMYQRFNRNLLKTARDSGLLDDTAFQRLTRDMDYYSFYREVFDTTAAPGMPTKTASKFELRPMKGGTHGNLVGDPVYVMTNNAMFWVDAIAKNLAAQKSFKLARDMGVARILGATEKPDQGAGEEEQVMFFRENGVTKRFAVSDPLLVTALGSDDRADMGAALRIMAMPTSALRELITRDPGFMFANLARDTLSAWITSGANITPFIGTAKGFAKALKKGSSYQALMGRGVVGSYDLAMRGPQEVAAELRKRATPSNVLTLNGPEALQNVMGGLWNRLGALSEYSDAATRIAVYEAAKAQGLSDAEATFRAIEIMDFSRRGASQLLSVLTKLVPFLNARIQGLDVLYQAGKAGYKVATGQARGEGEANLGKKFLVRGSMLAAISMVLEMMNDGDEDYEQLDDYIKTSNLLIPLKFFGLEGQFLAIPNPFETGLIFSTLPRQLYKTWTGDASTRDNAKLFVSSFGSTFGVNPIPQFMLPALEIIVNHDFYTGLPLIPEGKARLSPELQYNSRTSQLAMMIGKLPVMYDFNSGKFEGISPIVIDQLISGYGGPLGTYIAEGVGLAMESQNIGPERLPRDITQLPVVRRFFMDAQVKNPKVVTQAYELFRIVDEANRSFSRLRQTGDAEAVVDYLDKNRDVLSYKRYVFKLVDRLNKLSAHERQIERDTTMTDAEKKEAMAKLRETRIRIASKVSEINEKLGR